MSCCDLDLQGSGPNVARDTSSEYGDHFYEFFLKYDLKLWARHNFAARLRCDLDLQGRNPNVARDTSSQHGGHLYKIVLKSDF